MEQQLISPNYRDLLPNWYEVTSIDYKNLYEAAPFTKHSYALRVVVVIVYFHKKFQRGSAKTAWMEFQNAVQFDNERRAELCALQTVGNCGIVKFLRVIPRFALASSVRSVSLEQRFD